MLSPRRTSRRLTLAIGVAWAAITVACSARRRGEASSAALPIAERPAGADTLAGVQWVRVPVPTGGMLLAAVARPAGVGPHPVLVILHGTHGFAREYIALARELAREADVVAIAACWFAGRKGAGVAFVTPIECSEAPPLPSTGMTPEALAAIDALVNAARTLPGVRADRVALFGHSRGAVAALYYALEREDARRDGRGIQAVVLESGAYPPEIVNRAAALSVPVLLLHGTADGPAEGGSEMTTAVRARAFEAALLAANKVVEAEYFEGARHSALFYDAERHTRTVRRVAEFLRRQGFHLRSR